MYSSAPQRTKAQEGSALKPMLSMERRNIDILQFMKLKRLYTVAFVVLMALMASASPAAASSHWFDATNGQLLDTGWSVEDTNTALWAQARRAANEFCGARGFVGGFLNGHQSSDHKGVICIRSSDAQWFDATNGQLLDTGWPVEDTNTALWAQARRAANEFCGARGFVGGFLNGHQSSDRKGVICVR